MRVHIECYVGSREVSPCVWVLVFVAAIVGFGAAAFGLTHLALWLLTVSGCDIHAPLSEACP